MKNIKLMLLACLIAPFVQQTSLISTSKSEQRKESKEPKINIQIILGSTRKGRTSDKIGKAIQAFMDKNPLIKAEIVDLKAYKLPFLSDQKPPMTRTKFTNNSVAKFSKKISKAHGFIIVFPEYNAGYPGVLKNALDTLYAEWANKPVGFVAYSGGPSGGSSALNQLKSVVQALQMKPLLSEVMIPQVWSAFDDSGSLKEEQAISEKINAMTEQIISIATHNK